MRLRREQFLGDTPGAFPAGARNLQSTLGAIARIARSKYSNLVLGYVASRISSYDPARSAGACRQGFGGKRLIVHPRRAGGGRWLWTVVVAS